MAVQIVQSTQDWSKVAYPRVLRFTGAHCAPCRTSKPAYEAAASAPDLRSWASFWECDASAQPDLAAAYGVRVVPMIFVEVALGRVTQVAGTLSPSRLLAHLRELRDRA